MNYFNFNYDYPAFLAKLDSLSDSDLPCWVVFDKRTEGLIISPSKYSQISPEQIFAPDIYVKVPRLGGTMVLFPEGIQLFHIYKNGVYMGYDFKNMLIKWLRAKGLNATLDKNDILVDGYKIAGDIHSTFPNGLRYYGICISINMDLDKLKLYCDKEMKKIPKGLSDYGITRDELMAAIMQFIDEQ